MKRSLGTAISTCYWSVIRAFGVERLVWNTQYAKGRWHETTRSPVVVEMVSELCRGGKLVEFGCGSGSLPTLLPRACFSTYKGLDISTIAIRKATFRNLESCQFEQGSMEEWKGDKEVSLCLAEECLYYLSAGDQRKFLKRCSESLLPQGVILVIVHDGLKHLGTLDVCRDSCPVRFQEQIGSRVYLALGKCLERASAG